MPGSWMSISTRSGISRAAIVDGIEPGVRLDHFVAGGGQEIDEDLAVVLVVVDDQDALALVIALRGVWRFRRSVRGASAS